jgi:hypothetical protein
MPTNINKKFRDMKSWEMTDPPITASAAGVFLVASDGPDQSIMRVSAAASVQLYDPFEGGYSLLPSPALAGTFGVGACGRYHPSGPTGTAQAGSGAATLVTTLTINNDLRKRGGRYFLGRVTGGTGAGQDFRIEAHTSGANATFTIGKIGGGNLTTALDATSTFVLLTGRFYILSAGVLAAGAFKYWDFATATWSGNLTITTLPATVGTDSRLVCTSSAIGLSSASAGTGLSFASGTSTGSNTSTTLNNSAKTWTVNQWTNSQVRITSGTGAGQVRTIASNTATALTVSAAWTVTPDATSVYSIEGNDDHIYYFGSAAVAAMRYSISGNAWTLLAPGAARSGAPGAGLSAHWVYGCTAPNWGNESAIINGRRIYSFRGAGSAVLDYFDTAATTWVSAVTYGNNGELPTGGASWTYDGENRIYLSVPAVSGFVRFAAFDLYANALQPIGTLPYIQGALVVGDKLTVQSWDDGLGVPAKYLYQESHSVAVMHRSLVI